MKTDKEWVFEFQHSPIKPEERQAREAFYSKLIWVVDGTHLKRAKKQFFRVWDEGSWVSPKPALRKISFPQECELIRKWLGCRAPVFFDFGEGISPIESTFWCLLPNCPDGETYVAGFIRENFINFHLSETTETTPGFAELMKSYNKMISDYNAQREIERRQQFAFQPRYGGDPLNLLLQHQARLRWVQRRRRF